MAEQPVLRVQAPNGPVTAIALVLHGGQSVSAAPVPRWAPAALRMIPFAVALRSRGRAHGLVVARLRYRQRGWNGAAQSPAGDAAWALDQLSRRYPDVPIGLIGHSMGGRAAFYVAGHPDVESVVGLAPWIEPTDAVEPLRGRRLLIIHGDQDRNTSPIQSARFAERARAEARQATYLQIQGEQHAMLRRAPLWHDLAVGFTVGALLDLDAEGTTNPVVTNAVRKALSGEHTLVV
jgi:dienelactone hydrolase